MTSEQQSPQENEYARGMTSWQPDDDKSITESLNFRIVPKMTMSIAPAIPFQKKARSRERRLPDPK